MKYADIVTHMMGTLPLFTDKVTTALSISAMSVVGSIVTVVTSSAHGLSVASSVMISGTKVKSPVTSLTNDGIVGTAVTSADHDITRRKNEVGVTCEIIGADQSEYNGTFPVLIVNDRFRYQFQLSVEPTVSPATGTIFSIRDRFDGFNGGFPVASIVDTTTFTYDLGFTAPGQPEFSVGIAHVDFRILGVTSLDVADSEYTKRGSQNDYFLFVVLGDAVASRSRSNENDHSNSKSIYSEKRIDIIRPIEIYVYAPSKDDLGGSVIRDEIETFAEALYKTLHGWNPPTHFEAMQGQSVSLTGHRFFEYRNSYYVHLFEFEGREDINIEDSYRVLTRAFRDISLTVDKA